MKTRGRAGIVGVILLLVTLLLLPGPGIPRGRDLLLEAIRRREPGARAATAPNPPGPRPPPGRTPDR